MAWTPPAHSTYTWQNAPSTATPLDATHLAASEQDSITYTQQVGGLLGVGAVATKLSNYGASAGDFVPVDTTSGAITVTLPTAPADQTRVGVKLINGTNTVNYTCGGLDVLNKVGGATTGTLTNLNQTVMLQYQASTSIWHAQNELLPSAVTASSPLGDALGRTQVLQTSSIQAPSLATVVTTDDAGAWGAGAPGNAQRVTDGTMTSGANVVGSASAGWNDTRDTGKLCEVVGAGSGGTNFNLYGYLKVVGGVASLYTSLSFTTPQNAGTSVTGATVQFMSDDSPTVTAMGAAISTHGGGRLLFNPLKTYALQSMTPASNVTYDGQGAVFYIAPNSANFASASQGFAIALGATNVSNVAFRNMHLKGHGFEPSRVGFMGLSSFTTILNGLWIEGCIFDTIAPDGVDVTAQNVFVRGNLFTGVTLQKPPGAGSIGNVLNLMMGFPSQNLTQVIVTGNIIENATGVGIDLTPGSFSTRNQTATFKANISNNVISQGANAECAIMAELGGSGGQSTYLPQDCTVSNNTITGGSGINFEVPTGLAIQFPDVMNEQRIVIAANTINTPLLSGAPVLVASGSFVSMLGNNIYAQAGISLRSTNVGVTATGDFVNGSATINNVAITSPSNAVLRNGDRLTGTGITGQAYLLDGDSTTTWTMSDTFTGTTGTGLGFLVQESARHNTVADNTVHIAAASSGTVNAFGAQFVCECQISDNLFYYDPGATTTSNGAITILQSGWINWTDNVVTNAPGNRVIFVSNANDVRMKGGEIRNQTGTGQTAIAYFGGIQGLNEVRSMTIVDDRPTPRMATCIAGSTNSGLIVEDNTFSGMTGSALGNTGTTGAFIKTRNNHGYNPVGTVTVTVPATTVATGTAPYDRIFYITAGASTCQIGANGTNPIVIIPANGVMAIKVFAGNGLTPTYTSAPTWKVQGE